VGPSGFGDREQRESREQPGDGDPQQRGGGCERGGAQGPLLRRRLGSGSIARERVAVGCVERPLQHQPEEQRERREQDHGAREHRGDQSHQRVSPGSGGGHREPRQQRWALGERPPGDDRGDGHCGAEAGGLVPPGAHEQERGDAGER
jgi:hypothetical protein